MPIYEISVEKTSTDYPEVGVFSNRYHVNTGNVASALAAGYDIALIEQLVFPVSTTYGFLRAILPHVRGAGGNRYVGGTGGRITTGSVLPPWNVAVCRFKSELTSYAVKKFLRVGLTEDDVAGQALEAPIYGLLVDYCNSILTTTFACMPDGDSFDPTRCTPDGTVRMRQPEHHRIHKPGFKRGWVPV